MAHREFVEARMRLDECLREIEAMYQSIDRTRVEISEAEKASQARSVDWVCTMESFVEGQKRRIEKERLRARDLIRVVEDKEDVLLKRMSDRKAMDKLKETRFDEYKEEAARQELKDLDDLTSARQMRGKR